jgi:hypothetical protein
MKRTIVLLILVALVVGVIAPVAAFAADDDARCIDCDEVAKPVHTLDEWARGRFAGMSGKWFPYALRWVAWGFCQLFKAPA